MQNAPREHSAILLTFIKLPFVFETLFCLLLSGHLRQVSLYSQNYYPSVLWTSWCKLSMPLHENYSDPNFHQTSLVVNSSPSSAYHQDVDLYWLLIELLPFMWWKHMLFFYWKNKLKLVQCNYDCFLISFLPFKGIGTYTAKITNHGKKTKHNFRGGYWLITY